MYFLSPPKEWLAFKADVRNKPKPKKDNSNQLMTERWPREGQNPRPLKHFPGLPDQVSVVSILLLQTSLTVSDFQQ